MKVGDLIKLVIEEPGGYSSTQWYQIQQILSRAIRVDGSLFSRKTGRQVGIQGSGTVWVTKRVELPSD